MSATTYSMNDPTFDHLTAWCDSFYREEEATEKRNQILDMLEAMSPEDAEYSLAHGWQHVANLLK